MPVRSSTSTTYTFEFPIHVLTSGSHEIIIPAIPGRFRFEHRTAVSALHRRNSYGREMNVLKVAWGLKWEHSVPVKLETAKMTLFSETREIERQYLLGKDGLFPPKTDGELSFQFSLPLSEPSVKLEITMEGNMPSSEQKADNLSEKAAAYSKSLDNRHRDVRLYCPREQRALWTTAEVLCSQIPYFQMMLESKFVEGRKITSGSTSTGEYLLDPEFEDSDAESEADGAPTEDDCASLFHEVIIADASYNTFKAVLIWLATGQISFAPLTSSFYCDGNTIEEARAIRRAHVASVKIPILSVSPKSVYRLAHFLSLDTLATLALDCFRSKLTVSNVVYELLSDIALVYEAIGHVCLSFVSAHWEQVRTTSAFKEQEREFRDRSFEGVDGLRGRLLKSTVDDLE